MSSESNEILISIILGSVIMLIILFLLIIIFISYVRRKIKFEKEKLMMQSTFYEELLKTRLEIQEETFKTISQEIHDNIGQALSFVKLNLTTVDPHNAALMQEKITESKDLLSKSIHDLRDIARSLNPDFLNEIGLPCAIEQQLQLLDKTTRYKTSFTVTGEVYKNNLQRELVVFRIVQELLNNIVKHAEANAINIEIEYLQEKLMITVHDNGKGFDTVAMQSMENNNGLGLRNMFNRMTLINGYISINSSATDGTTAIIELPKALSLKT